MKYLVLINLLFVFSACSTTQQIKEVNNNAEPQKSIKIAFGSCAEEDKPQPLLSVAKSLNPDIFIYLGDNIYGDTYSMDTLQMKYDMLADKKEFQELVKSTPILATWDDHDYGWNDAGRHYPYKEESKEIFMDFWNIPQDSDRRQHKGIYGEEFLDFDGYTVQVILLDTRTFRDDLALNDGTKEFYKNDYKPNTINDSTFLGNQQWKWLKTTLQKKADFRIVASSNQFSHEYNGWESWTNVPVERQKFIDLIAETKAENLVFISGDVHWGELSKLNTNKTYPLYDVTSSGITEKWYNTEPNSNRIGEVFRENNIGLIEIIPAGENTKVTMQLYDVNGKPVVEHTITTKELTF